MSHVWQSTFPYTEDTRAMLQEEVLGGARRWPDRVALVDATDGRSLTYGEIADRAQRLAGGLLAGGARQGDVLALVAGNAPGVAIVAHGALLAGLTLAPASALLTARELGAFLRQTGARYVVADAAAMPTVNEAASAAGVQAVFALGALPSADPIVAEGGDPDAIALLMSTSGTSGLPKSAAHTHAGAVATLRQYAASPPRRFGPDDVVAGVVPFAHMFGWVMLNSALRAGARMVTLARFELEAFLRMIQDHRVSTAAVVPPVAHALARHPAVERYDLSSLRFLIVGAAPCPAEIERECEARLGCVVGQGLGMTEAAPIALPENPVRHGSTGRLVPGTQAMIVDPDTGERLGEGVTGELWFRGPQLMSGYLGDAAATAATIDAEGWLHSGDLGHFDADGNLFLVDRLKELIKVRGYQVAPAQLEAELTAHPAVADAAVVPRPDEESGEVPVAYVALCEPAEPGAIAAWVAERVAPYKRLADVIVVDAIPRAPTGKLLRRVLVERERAAVGPPTASVAQARPMRGGLSFSPR
jgi:acyl-CoA synthetase (AMP-forming)/AMP-acid ligase II